MRTEIIDSHEYAAAVADEIVVTLQELASEKESVSVALSGGSTPGEVYRLLSIPPRCEDIPWGSLKIFLGDERFVPDSDPRSNYHMVAETLLHGLKSPPKIFPLDTRRPQASEAAALYEQTLRKEIATGSVGVPEIDLLLLGVGGDLHTASLFPGSSSLVVQDALCIASEHPTDGTTRLTLTFPMLLAAKQIFFLVKGESKAEVIRKLLKNPEALSLTDAPASFYTQVEQKVTWFLDSGAAIGLR